MDRIKRGFYVRPALVCLFLMAFSACNNGVTTSSSSEKEGLLIGDSLLSPLAGSFISPAETSHQERIFETQNDLQFSYGFSVSDQTRIPIQSLSSGFSLTPEEITTEFNANGNSVTETTYSDKLEEDLPLMDEWKDINGDDINSFLRTFEDSLTYKWYVKNILGALNHNLKRMNSQERQSWSYVCNDLSCSQGLSLTSLDGDKLIRLVHDFVKMFMFSSYNVMYHSNNEALYLEGNIAKEEDLRHIMEVAAKTSGTIKRVVVNLSNPWDQMPPFVADLGLFIKKNEIDLHIIGRCNSFCANILVPAAHKVVIEPSGYIAYTGGSIGLSIDVGRVIEENTIELRKGFYWDYFPEGNIQELANIFHAVPPNEAYFLLNATPFVMDAFNNFLANRNKVSWEDLSFDEINDFLQNDLSGEDIIAVKNRIFEGSEYYKGVNRTRALFLAQKEKAHLEMAYYEKLGKASGRPYAYPDLVDLSAWVVKQDLYDEDFVVNRMFLDMPEKDRPYKAVLFSEEILRQAGIPIIGRNHPEFVRLLHGDEADAFLFLEARHLKNCDFFSRASGLPRFTESSFNMCLSRGENETSDEQVASL